MDIIILAIIGSIGLAIALNLLGNFILWHKISYMGDTIAHISLLGITLSLVIPYFTTLVTILVCFMFAFFITLLNKKANITKDALMVTSTQFSLSLGLLIFALAAPSQSLNNYFFGNILAFDLLDIVIIYILAILVIIYIFRYYHTLLLIAVNEEIATAEGINTFMHNMLFMFFLSCVIAFSIKLAGILLIPSLLIIPAIISINISKTPIVSIVISTFLAVIATTIGILLSIYINVAASALITLTLIVILVLVLTYRKFLKQLFN